MHFPTPKYMYLSEQKRSKRKSEFDCGLATVFPAHMFRPYNTNCLSLDSVQMEIS